MKGNSLNRRKFFTLLSAGSAALAVKPLIGLRGCFNGGPGANPQFFCNYNTLLVASDPVATDRIAYDIIAEKRIAEGLLKVSNPGVLQASQH